MIRKIISQSLLWLTLLVGIGSVIFFNMYLGDASLQEMMLSAWGAKEEAFAMMLLQYSAIALGIMYILGYILSLDSRLKRRPFIAIIAGAFGLGFSAAALSYGFLFFLEVEDGLTGTAWLAGVGGGIGAIVVVLAFEFTNRWLWQTIVTRLDQKNMGGSALLFSRMALIFRPGQDALLCSVSIELYNRGQRGEIVDRLEAYYEEGNRQPELLEALCQVANEKKQPERYLKYLNELFRIFPEEEQLRDALTDELVEQGHYKEAMAIVEQHGCNDDVDSLEKHAIICLETERLDRAVELAGKLSREEGIPMRRSDAVLRQVLTQDSRHVEAINMLADHAKRMARKDQQIRWLDQSIMIDASQVKRGEELLDLLEQAKMSRRIEEILSVMVLENPDKLDLCRKYGEALSNNGKQDEAIEFLQRLRDRGIKDVSILMLLANISYEGREFEITHEVLDQILSLEPSEQTKEKAQNLLKKVERAELTSEIADMLEKCKENPQDFEYNLKALNHLLKSNHLDRAIAQADNIISHHPDSRTTVIKTIREAFEEIPSGGYPLLSFLADLQVAESKYDDALETVKLMAERTTLNKESAIREGAQKILRKSPHHLKTLRTIGEMYREAGQFTDMIHAYTLYLSNGGDETEEIDRALAQAYISLDDYPSARRFVLHLLTNTEGEEAEEKNIEMLHRVIPLAVQSDHAVDAAEFMEKLELMDTDNKIALKSMRAKVNDAMGEQRFKFLKKELEAGKVDSSALEELGDLRLEAEDYNQAITYYQRAARQLEKNRIAQAKLAFAFAKKRMFDLASETMTDMNLSLEDDPEELETLMGWLYRTGEVLEAAHMFNSASKLFKQLMKIDAGYRDVIQKVERLGMK